MHEPPEPALASPESVGDTVSFGPFRFDRAGRLLFKEGRELPLPPRAILVLDHLVSRPGAVISKQALMDGVWKDAFVTETSLTEAVSLLRQALGDDAQQPAYVQTVHRRGYRFVADVRQEPRGAARPEWTARPEPQPRPARPMPATPRPSRPLLAALAVALVAVAGFAWWRRGSESVEPSRPLARVVVPIEPGDPSGIKYPPALAITPDGRHLVYAVSRGGASQIYVRAMDRFDSVPLVGTEGASCPFLSPDGEWVGFFADGKLKKIPRAGGTPITLCDAPSGQGASWGDDGTIVFASGPDEGLRRVSAHGGSTQDVTRPRVASGELGHWWPEVLPGSRAVVFTIWPTGGLESARVALVLLDGALHEPRVLAREATFGRYASTGHLVFARKSRLMAVPFEPGEGVTVGEPAGVFDGVAVDWFTGAAEFSLSREGTLAYLPGTHEVPAHALAVVDRAGKAVPLPTPSRPFMNLDVSRDGRRAAATIHEGTGSDIWAVDVERGALERLTFEAHNIEPAWTPDGERIAFASSRSGPYNLFWTRADGSGVVERLIESERNQYPDDWSPDGRVLAFTELAPETGSDLWALPRDAPRKARPLLVTRFNEESAAFSPDGRFLAYESNETSRAEVYVRAYPGMETKWQVSTAGGRAPFWSPDGRDLFYRTDEGLMAVPIEWTPTFRPGHPRPLFEDAHLLAAAARGAGRIMVIRGDEPMALRR